MNEKIIEREQKIKASNSLRTTAETNLIFAGNTKYWEYICYIFELYWTGPPIKFETYRMGLVSVEHRKKIVSFEIIVIVPYRLKLKKRKKKNNEKEEEMKKNNRQAKQAQTV